MIRIRIPRKAYLGFILGGLSLGAHATPINNYADTNVVHSIAGTDRFYTKSEKSSCRISLSPFYQHAGAARGKDGIRTEMGDRLGKWNIAGIFFGRDATPKPFTAANYPTLYPIINTHMPSTGANAGHFIYGTTNANLTAKPEYAHISNEDKYNPEINTLSLFENVKATYEKMGLRGQITLDFGFGMSLAMKTGIVDYKVRPTFNIPTEINGAKDKNLTTASVEEQAKKIMYDILYSPLAQKKIFNELELDIEQVRKTAMEDLHLQLQWHFPQELREQRELAVTVIPSFAIGSWLPTGKGKDQDKAFSLDTGNGGFCGITFEGAISFDFPQLMQANLGGGVVVSMSRELNNYRVPSQDPNVSGIKQQGFYPWKTTISKTPGLTWYANASLKSEGFSGDLSLYLDYVYTYHQRDKIKLREQNLTRRNAFQNGVPHLERESHWKSQLYNIGLDYRIHKNLSAGAMVQGMINGTHILKETLIMGSITFLF